MAIRPNDIFSLFFEPFTVAEGPAPFKPAWLEKALTQSAFATRVSAFSSYPGLAADQTAGPAFQR